MMLDYTLGHTIGQAPFINAGKCINRYPVVEVPGDADTTYRRMMISMYPRPGLRQWARPGGAGEVRGFDIWDGSLYAIIGNTLWRQPLTGSAATNLYEVGSSSGKAWLNHNANGQMLFVAGNTAYSYVKASGLFAQEHTEVGSCAFLSNYGIVSIAGTAGQIKYSALNDFTTWSTLDYVTAERNPDAGICVFADHGELLIMGAKTVEFFYDAGEAYGTFRRRQDAFLEIGIGAAASIAADGDVVYFLDQTQKNVRMMAGYTTKIISTPAISWIIAQLSERSTAKAMAFTHNNRLFYIITFPEITLAYDATESLKADFPLWHMLRSFPYPAINRWRGNCAVEHEGKVYVGDYENGWIYTLEDDEYQDNGEPLIWTVTTQPVSSNDDRVWLAHDQLAVPCDVVSTDGIESMISLRHTDNGYTWSNEHMESAGSVGQYGYTTRWDDLGASRQRVYELSGSSATKMILRPPRLKGTKGSI